MRLLYTLAMTLRIKARLKRHGHHYLKGMQHPFCFYFARGQK